MVITVVSVESSAMPGKTKLKAEISFLHSRYELQRCQEIYDKTHLGNMCKAFSALRVFGKQLLCSCTFLLPQILPLLFFVMLLYYQPEASPEAGLSPFCPKLTLFLSLPFSLVKQCCKYILSIVFSEVPRESWHVIQASLFTLAQSWRDCAPVFWCWACAAEERSSQLVSP